jgi:hypothetical protein
MDQPLRCLESSLETVEGIKTMMTYGYTRRHRWNKKKGGSEVVPPLLPPYATMSVTTICKKGNPYTNFWLYFLLFSQILFSFYFYSILSLYSCFGWSNRDWFNEERDLCIQKCKEVELSVSCLRGSRGRPR